jgi:hypothetical protein
MEMILQSLKANLKKWAILALIVIGGLFGFKACRKVQQKQDKQATSPVLGPNQQEKITVDPTKHTITVVTKNGTTTTYLPDRPTQIIESKDGKLSVIDHKYGTEVKPFLGFGTDLEGSPRVHIGADLFYWNKFDLGTGLAFNATHLKDTRLALNLSYNFYSNTSIAFSFDNHKTPGLFLKVRF